LREQLQSADSHKYLIPLDFHGDDTGVGSRAKWMFLTFLGSVSRSERDSPLLFTVCGAKKKRFWQNCTQSFPGASGPSARSSAEFRFGHKVISSFHVFSFSSLNQNALCLTT
jgi:hypothetical protein